VSVAGDWEIHVASVHIDPRGEGWGLMSVLGHWIRKYLKVVALLRLKLLGALGPFYKFHPSSSSGPDRVQVTPPPPPKYL
jgi:hypothetical protein